MKIGDFNKIYKFMGEDTFVYLVPLRTISIRECSSLSKEIASAIKSASLPHIYININIQGKSNRLSLQNISANDKCSNSILVKHKDLLKILPKLGLNIDESINKGIVIVKPIEDIRNQERRKRTILNLPIRPITGRIKDEKFTKWIDDTYKELKNSATTSENRLYNKLHKSLGNRIKRQSPFVIDGKVYYADLCIKSLRLIIEVDGGYHNTDAQKKKDEERDKAFTSIGYKTIRCSNEDACSKKFANELLKTIESLKMEKRERKKEKRQSLKEKEIIRYIHT